MKDREETRLALCIKVCLLFIFWLLLLIESGFENVISRVLKVQAPADAAKSKIPVRVLHL